MPKKRKRFNEKDVIKVEGNVIYYDFVYTSMLESIITWYSENYQWDDTGIKVGSHIAALNMFYDPKKFSDPRKTVGHERDKLLEQIDLYIQMKSV